MITLTQAVSGTSTVVARVAIGREIPDLKHLALTVDGNVAKVYFRGRLLMTGTLSTTMTIDRVELQGGTKDTLLSEMLLMPRVAEPEDIKTWWNLRAPFYDPSPVIQEDQIPAAETWNKAVYDAQKALADAADAQATADGKVTTFYQDTEPIAEALGDLWVHTGEDNKLYRWSGSSWEVVQDKKIQEAVQKAEDAQATADGKIVTFYQSTPPTATAVGDLWVDTDDNNHLYRWDGTQWVDIQDKSPIPDERIPSAESWNKKNRTYYQDTPPTGTHSLGDVWFDTSDHNRRHWWDGSKWVDAEDVSPIDASQRPVTSRGLGGDIEMDHEGMRFIRKADGKIVMQLDIETGSGFYDGDLAAARVTAALAEFGGIVTDDVLVKSADGSTFFDGNTIVTKDNLGNRSELSAGRLTFYRELPGGEEESAYYVARMISGTASDGQTIPINFERPPKVLVAPNLLTLPPRLLVWDNDREEYMLFDPSSKTWEPYTDYQIEAYASNVTESGFTVWCRVTGNRTTQYVPMSPTILTESTPSRVSGYSETPIDVISVDLRFVVSVRMYDRSKVQFHFHYDIEYQASGSSTWVKAVDNAREIVEINRGFSLIGWVTKSKTHNFKREIVVPTPGIYRVRVTRRSVSYHNWWWPGNNEPRDHGMTTHFMGWTGTGAEVLTTGTANYIAIE